MLLFSLIILLVLLAGPSQAQEDTAFTEIKVIYAKKPGELAPSRIFVVANKKDIHEKLINTLEGILKKEDIYYIKPKQDTVGLFFYMKKYRHQLVHYEKHYYATDCILGITTFSGGVIFILFFGEDYKPSRPPGGIFVNVGDRYIEGVPGTCTASACWFTGIYLFIKSLFEQLYLKGTPFKKGFQGDLQKYGLEIENTVYFRETKLSGTNYFRRAVREVVNAVK
jgi:hypothetical protein